MIEDPKQDEIKITYNDPTKFEVPSVQQLEMMGLAAMQQEVKDLVRLQQGQSKGFCLDGRAATARFLFKEAMAAWNQGLHGTAHRLLENGVAMFPNSDHEPGMTDVERHVLYNLELRLGISYLSMGDLERGWPLYNRRKEPNSSGWSPARDLGMVKRWSGEDLLGKTLVIYPEQGLGDHLLALRPLLAGWVLPEPINSLKELRIECHWELKGLLTRVLGHVPWFKFIDPKRVEEVVQGADYCCSYMDLLAKLAPTADSISPLWIKPHVTALPEKVEQHKLFTTADTLYKPLVIGVSWRGHNDKWDKGMSIEDLRPLWLLLKLRTDIQALVLHPVTEAEHEFLCYLQANDPEFLSRVHIPLTLPGKGLYAEPPTIEDYLGLLEQCEVVVGVRSTTMHLAASMGIRTHVLCPDGPRNPWYWAMDAGPNGQPSRWYGPGVTVWQGDLWPTEGEKYETPWARSLWWRVVDKLSREM